MKRTGAAALAIAALAGTTAFALGRSRDAVAGDQPAGERLTPMQEMIWKYTARCALRPDQELAGPGGPSGPRFKGEMGLGPGWQSGACDEACQERVSSCLLALMNRTGKHVEVSLLSAAPSMPADLRASDADAPFPHQEGAFFGNVFRGQAFACHGTGSSQAAQVDRFCAADPSSCSGLVAFVDAGRCDDACEMSCAKLSDGSQRCTAVRCQDPTGRTWDQPITTYVHDVGLARR